MNRRRRIVKCVVFILVLGLLSISYAAHTNVLIGDFSLSTGSMNFIFDKEDVAITIQQGENGIVKKITGTPSYTDKDKKLNIQNIGPIDIEDLRNGNMKITIEYAIKVKDEEQGIKRPAEIKEEDQRYDLGNVVFKRTSDTLVWNLENGGQSWGTADLGITPEVIKKYLPVNLVFHAYNTLLAHSEEGVMAGTLVLMQEDIPELPNSMEIGLSSLNLPTEISDEIKNCSPESTLEIEGTYGFAIPLNLDQFNVEK